MIEGEPLTVGRIVQHVLERRTHLSNRARVGDRDENKKAGFASRELTRLLDWIEEHADKNIPEKT